MSIYDKVIYYSSLVGLSAVLLLVIGMLVGFVHATPTAIGKVIILGMVGIGLFIRGYRAKQIAKQQEGLQEMLEQLKEAGFTIEIEQEEEESESDKPNH